MRLPVVLAAAAALTAAAPAQAAPRVPPPPMSLPGDATASAVRADPRTWIVGAQPTAAAARIAGRFGAERILDGAYEVRRGRARALAAALRERGLLTFAEPNRLSRFRQRAVADDPLSARSRWRDAAVDPALAPPPVTPTSPAVALVDARADASHPEFEGGNLTVLDGQRVQITHGTATAAVAAAPQNGVGIVGVWPGMRAFNVPLPSEFIRCSDSARGIRRAIGTRAKVINMSYGSPTPCQAEFMAIQLATRRGINLVAAAGNEFAHGNPLEFPASLPHVLTVGASTPQDKAAFFSNENAAMDLVAPGVGILTAVPVGLDNEDGTKDGYEFMDGTSFAAPMVAAATAWLRAVRPELTVDQAAQVIRLSARDINTEGYDSSTGFGALDLANALQRRPPVKDPMEPNEDIPFVNGDTYDGAAKAIWSGGDSASFRALLDYYEDPGDVYRVRVPAGRRVRVTVTPRFGNPDVELYTWKAKHVGQARRRVSRSRHTGTRLDTVSWRNRGGRTRTAYVRVHLKRQRTLDAGYTITAAPR